MCRLRRGRNFLLALVAAFASVLACGAQLTAYADCQTTRDVHAITGTNATAEWATYCQGDGEEYEYSSADCFSFKQQYAKLQTFDQFDWCGWEPQGGYNYDFPGNYFFASMTDVEDSYGNNGGIPFSINHTNNGTRDVEWWHHRNNKTVYDKGFLNDTDDWYGAPVYDPQWDQVSKGSTSYFYDDKWDPDYQGNVVSYSTDAAGGRNTWFVGVDMDYGW